MTLCVVILDVFKLRRLLERRYIPVQLPQPLMQRRITRSDIADVALEMLHIDGVEANDGSIEANVRFGDVGTEIVGSSVSCSSKVSLSAVKGGEKGFDALFISFLGSGDGELVTESLAKKGMGTREEKGAYVAKPDL